MVKRLLNLFRRRGLDRELDIEVRYHLESLEAEYREHGLSSEAARLAARRDFGGVLQAQEAYRDQRGIPMLETLWRDVRFSFRSMRRTPAVTLAVIATLAIGIGANTAIFSVVNGVLIKPLPYPDSDRLVLVSHTAPGINVADLGSAPFLYFTEREQNQTLDGVGLVGEINATVTGRGEPEVVHRLHVTADILRILRTPPLVGRYFTESDNAPGAPHTVVLTYGYWQRRFGGDESAIGQTITMDGEQWNIIGVAPQRFRYLDRPVDMITPQKLDRSSVAVGGFFWPSIARLKPGVTLEQASADVRRMVPIALNSFPMPPGKNGQRLLNSRLGPSLRPLKQEVVGNIGNTLWVVMGTLGLVLLMACANVANLILARTQGRQQELSVRAALGAGRGRITRELLTESAVLSLTGGALGIGVAYICVQLLPAIQAANLPRIGEVAIDSTVVLFAAGISCLSSFLVGAIPVMRHSRPSLISALHSEGRWSSGSRQRPLTRGVLVVVQVALAAVLLIGAGLMIRTFRGMMNVNPGFSRADELETLRIQIPQASVADPELTARREQEILERLARIPGVISTALISDAPLAGGVAADLISPEDKVFGPGETPRPAQSRFISPGVFATMGIPLVKGRDLNWTDIYERRPVVIVSEDLAQREWGSPDRAVGKRMRGSSTTDQWREIIGVVGAIHDRGLNQPVVPVAYYPVLGERVYNNPVFVWRFVTYVIRSPRAGTPSLLDEIRQAVWAVDSNLPLVDPRTMAKVVEVSVARTSFTMLILGIAGVMALLLGLIGLYAVISYTVTERRREVGIRIALGAARGAVRSMFVRQGLVLTTIGAVLGLGAAVGLTRWMKSLLYEVSPLDPWTYAVVSMILLITAVLACYLPARRATRIDPAEALRTE
jgi:predicted permease